MRMMLYKYLYKTKGTYPDFRNLFEIEKVAKNSFKNDKLSKCRLCFFSNIKMKQLCNQTLQTLKVHHTLEYRRLFPAQLLQNKTIELMMLTAIKVSFRFFEFVSLNYT